MTIYAYDLKAKMIGRPTVPLQVPLSLTENSCLLESFPKPGTFPKRLHFLPANSYDHAPKISCSIPEFSWFITFCKPTPHPTMWRSERSVLKQLPSNSNLAHPLPLAEFGNPYDHKTLFIRFPYRTSNNTLDTLILASKKFHTFEFIR